MVPSKHPSTSHMSSVSSPSGDAEGVRDSRSCYLTVYISDFPDAVCLGESSLQRARRSPKSHLIE